MLDGSGRAANHQTVTSLQPPNTAAGANIDILDSLRRELLSTPDVINVIGIAAVDQNVAGFEIGRNAGNGFVHDRCGNHQPDGARFGELAYQVLERRGTHGTMLHQLLNSLRGPVEHDAGMTVIQQTLHHVGAHSPQTYHS